MAYDSSRLRGRLRATVLKLRPTKIRVGPGAGLKFDPGLSNPGYASGTEAPVQHALADHLRPGSVLFDVGANVGFFSILGGRLVGEEGCVYAFEPVPTNVRYIERNASLNGMRNITVLEKAVSDRDGTGELVLAEYAGGAALATVSRPPDATTSISVELTSIDSLVLNGRLRPPSMVKIDVEGAEMEVLRGMEQTIRKYFPAIVCEVDDSARAGYEVKYAACTGFVKDLGYSVTELPLSYPGGDWIVGHFLAVALRRGT